VQISFPLVPEEVRICDEGTREMGWAHPAVAMEEVLRLVRGFVDVLVLAGGRTSSGAAATWSAEEVKKALRWALFFEEVSVFSEPLSYILEICSIFLLQLV